MANAPKSLAEAIRERRATPSFDGEPIPPGDLRQILEAGLQGATQIVVDISSRFRFERAVVERREETEMTADDLVELMLDTQRQTYGDGLDPEVGALVRAAIAELEERGCTVRPVRMPHTRYAVATYYVIATAEASSNLARFDGVRYGLRAPKSDTLAAMYCRTRDLGFGAEVKRRILLGTYVLSHGYYDAYYRKAQQVRRLLAEDFLAAFREVDAILTPTAPTPAFRIGEKSDDPVSMYLADIYTVTASLAGICGISVPCGQCREGLPIGMQILGKHFGEAAVFRVGQALEKASAE